MTNDREDIATGAKMFMNFAVASIMLMVFFTVGTIGLGLVIELLFPDLERSQVPSPGGIIEGAVVTASSPSLAELEALDIVWSTQAEASSHLYEHEPEHATGAPNVYPKTESASGRSWTSYHRDAGLEALELAWPEPIDARAIVIAETSNPGALVRIDDLTSPTRTSRSGRRTSSSRPRQSPSPGSPRASYMSPPEMRPVQRLRLVVQTNRFEGYHEIDAVGLTALEELEKIIARDNNYGLPRSLGCERSPRPHSSRRKRCVSFRSQVWLSEVLPWRPSRSPVLAEAAQWSASPRWPPRSDSTRHR